MQMGRKTQVELFSFRVQEIDGLRASGVARHVRRLNSTRPQKTTIQTMMLFRVSVRFNLIKITLCPEDPCMPL